MKRQSVVPLDKRLEQILTEIEMNNKQVKRLRRAKKELFSKINPHTKELLLKYEELESIRCKCAYRHVGRRVSGKFINGRNKGWCRWGC